MYSQRIIQVISQIKDIQLELSNRNAQYPTKSIKIYGNNNLSNDLTKIIISLEFLSKTLLCFFTKKNQQNIPLKKKVEELFNKIEKISISSSQNDNLSILGEIDKLCKEIIFIHEISNIRDIRDSGSEIKKDIKSLELNHIYKCYCSNHLFVYSNNHCKNETIQAHSISKSNNFIAKKYYSLYSNILDKYILSKIKFNNIAKEKASTSHTFCSYHDSDVFASKIEGNYNISTLDENHYFLQNMRIFYKRETEDLEKHFLKIKIHQKFPSVFDNELFYNQNIDSFIIDNLNSLENKIFQNKQKNPGVLYFTILLNPENSVKYLSSTCGDGSYLDRKTKGKTYVFFHLLQNKNNPCIIFSAFNTTCNKKLLTNIQNLYNENKKDFFELVASFSCIHENTFFTEDFINKKTLANKFLEFTKKDNNFMFMDSSNTHNRPFFEEKIQLTADEINFLFQVKDTHTNF